MNNSNVIQKRDKTIGSAKFTELNKYALCCGYQQHAETNKGRTRLYCLHGFYIVSQWSNIRDCEVYYKVFEGLAAARRAFKNLCEVL